MKKFLGILSIFIIRTIAWIWITDSDNSLLASVVSLRGEKQINTKPSATDLEYTSKVKQYKNDKYGVQFNYPGSFTLEEKTKGLGNSQDSSCPNLFRVILTDPNAPNVQYMYGEPIVKPNIIINIRKKSCYPSTITGTIDGMSIAAVIAGFQPILTLHQTIWPALIQKGFTENMSKTIAAAIPAHGEGNPTIWVDDCDVGSIQQTNNNITYIKNTNCTIGADIISISGGAAQTFYQTYVLIPHPNNRMFFDIKGGKDFYDSLNHKGIDTILNSLSLVSPSQVESEEVNHYSDINQ